jgi:hypothetical protein
MFTTGLSQAQVLASIQAKLINLRNAMNDAENLYTWSSGIAATDLENIGFSPNDAVALLSAIADAHALAQIYSTGQPPGVGFGGYPQASSAYPYAASQSQVIGPL